MEFGRAKHRLQPEWGYHPRRFTRTARIVLVAMAVGATTSASVLLLLVDRPVVAIAETSVAVRTLALPFEAEHAPVSTNQAARVETPALIEDSIAKPRGADRQGGVFTANEPSISSTEEVPGIIQ
jgi:hypothetical protein